MYGSSDVIFEMNEEVNAYKYVLELCKRYIESNKKTELEKELILSRINQLLKN
jgi:hypothetical protein